MKNSFREQKRVGDYVLFCDICGMKTWASESIILDKDTGKGGLVVCPVDRDAIDYGLVPYKVDPEESVPVARNNHYAADPENVPNTVEPSKLDLTTIDPMSINNPTTDPRLQ